MILIFLGVIRNYFAIYLFFGAVSAFSKGEANPCGVD